MSGLDYVIIGVLAALAAGALIVIIIRKRKGKGCSCGCESCPHPCNKKH